MHQLVVVGIEKLEMGHLEAGNFMGLVWGAYWAFSC